MKEFVTWEQNETTPIIIVGRTIYRYWEDLHTYTDTLQITTKQPTLIPTYKILLQCKNNKIHRTGDCPMILKEMLSKQKWSNISLFLVYGFKVKIL